IDEERFGRAVHAEVDGRAAFAIDHDGAVWIAELHEPLLRGLVVVAPVETDERQAPFARDVEQRGVLLAARDTPRAPDVEYPGPAGEIGETQLAAGIAQHR